MDEKNGQVFDHHVELFTQIGVGSSAGDPLRDFMLNQGGGIEANSGGKTVSVGQGPGVPSQDAMWAQGFHLGNQAGLTLVNHNRSGFSCPPGGGGGGGGGGGSSAVELLQNEVVNTSALLDSLVKSIPGCETVLDSYQSPCLTSKNADSKPGSGDVSNHMSNSLFGNLCRLNSEKVTHDLLETFNKLESSELLMKCGTGGGIGGGGVTGDFPETVGWNGLVCEGPNSLPFASQNRLVQSFQTSIDKNGNSALFGTSHVVDKMGNPSEAFGSQNNLIARLSPSASVETSVRTPATSYESASPLSNNRTPIRSDESISPMGSGHTPLRLEDSTSPLTNIKTPLRMEEGSPMGRTPLRVEESFSPMGGSNALLASNSPSHKANGPVQGSDAYSPPSGFKRLSETSSTVHPSSSSFKREENESSKVSEDGIRGEGSTNSKLPQGGDPVGSSKSEKRTLSRKSEGNACSGSSSLSGLSELDSRRYPTAVEDAKTEFSTAVPEAEEAERRGDFQRERTEDGTAFGDEFFANSSKRRRKKTENACVSGGKRRSRKRVTIYQSTMSPEETGIKLKIKLASAFQPVKPQKKRRSRKQYESDEETSEEETSSTGVTTGTIGTGSGTSKRSRKIVRFSGGPKEPIATEQTEWGEKIPPNVLQRIFEMVVEEQGCVPSLVRFSYVCKLWNSVANRPELWRNIDLSSPYIKQKCKIDRYFRWLLENRLDNIRELNLGGWKFSNITMVLSLIGTHCTEIESIGLGGWQGLHYEHLKSLLQDCPRLSKLDLSDVSPESKSANSAVSQKSITFLTQTMGDRLTQLILAHNTLTCLPQIITSLATHCPNLQVLDLSNIRRVSHTEFPLNVELLQEGCQKLKVLRITNSCITLANVPLEKQVASPGFTNLEELSIAGHQGTESLRITSVMDDTCLERILKTSHKLKLLDVRGCTRITDSSLVRVPAWDIQHLFLSGCYVTRQCGSGLELIAQKWSHSLVEVDLAWTTVTDDLNAAIMAFAEKGEESPLRVMNLCGSSVTLEPVKALLSKCTKLESLNLQSCRGLPRGVKRLYENDQLNELRNMLEKRDRDSGASDGEERRESECEGRTKESPMYSTNTKSEDLVT